MTFAEMIADNKKYQKIVREIWTGQKDSFPDYLPVIPMDTKLENEKYIQSLFNDFQKQFQSYRRIPIGRKRWRQKTLKLLNDVLYNESIIGLHHAMDQPGIDALWDEIREFLLKVRRFSPELRFNDIGQALRNYIVYAMFKLIHDEKSGFNMAGFGYSMLYPFTDNYIDNQLCSSEEKQEYNRIIHDKLKGNSVHPRNLHQTKTCELLQAIESVYPRGNQSSAYYLLLLMLDAQETSIRQQNRELPLTEGERLDISVYKGGISVLIDRYFVKKEITEEELIFYLGFGFFLQLADDLQDIKEDSSNGHSTLFTVDLEYRPEEKLVNQMLQFVHQIMEEFKAGNRVFKNFIISTCYLLIFTSVIGSREFFSQAYIDQIEEYLPVTYPFLEKLLNNRIENQEMKIQDNYMNLLDELLKK